MRLFSFRKGLLITGNPRAGKTTLIKYLEDILEKTFPEVKFFGFITEEVREAKGKRDRIGFDLVPVGETKKVLPSSLPLARKHLTEKDLPKVGSYTVLVENLERVLSILEHELSEKRDAVLILDEVGKMELKSPKFISFFEKVLERNIPFIATVGKGDHPFLQRVRNLEKVLLCEVTLENRDFLRERLLLEFLRPGILVVFEGIDGVGKTTVHKALAERLKNNPNIVFSYEPTNGAYGKKLREALKNGNFPKEERLSLFIKDRLEHVKSLIIPSLREGKLVILDRYYPSTIAYQGAEGFDFKELLTLNETIAPTPDLVIYFDLPVEVAVNRLKERGNEFSIFEKGEKLVRIAENYGKLFPLFKVHRIDALQSVDKLIEEVLTNVDLFKKLYKNMFK
ncbi:MAG: dTMP kinase [Thermodesulfobacteriaceae bacterium]